MNELVICSNCGEYTTLEYCEYMYHQKQCTNCRYCVDCEQYDQLDIESDESLKEKRYTAFPNNACQIEHSSYIHVEHEDINESYKALLLSKSITFQYINNKKMELKEINFFFLAHIIDDTITDQALSIEKDNKLWKQLQYIYTEESIKIFEDKLKRQFSTFIQNDINKDPRTLGVPL